MQSAIAHTFYSFNTEKQIIKAAKTKPKGGAFKILFDINCKVNIIYGRNTVFTPDLNKYIYIQKKLGKPSSLNENQIKILVDKISTGYKIKYKEKRCALLKKWDNFLYKWALHFFKDSEFSFKCIRYLGGANIFHVISITNNIITKIDHKLINIGRMLDN